MFISQPSFNSSSALLSPFTSLQLLARALDCGQRRVLCDATALRYDAKCELVCIDLTFDILSGHWRDSLPRWRGRVSLAGKNKLSHHRVGVGGCQGLLLFRTFEDTSLVLLHASACAWLLLLVGEHLCHVLLQELVVAPVDGQWACEVGGVSAYFDWSSICAFRRPGRDYGSVGVFRAC